MKRRQRREFNPLGARMRSFGLSVMRHYGVSDANKPTPYTSDAPSWTQDIDAPLPETPSTPTRQSAPPVVQRQTPPASAQQPTMPPVSPPAQAPSNATPTPQQPEAIQRTPKTAPQRPPLPKQYNGREIPVNKSPTDALLMRALEQQREREASRERLKEERISQMEQEALNASDARPPRLMRRGRLAVDYVKTDTLSQSEDKSSPQNVQREADDEPDMEDDSSTVDELEDAQIESQVQPQSQDYQAPVTPSTPPVSPITESVQRTTDDHTQSTPAHDTPAIADAPTAPIELPEQPDAQDYQAPVTSSDAPIADSVQRTTDDHATSTPAHDMPAPIQPPVQTDVQVPVTQYDDKPIASQDAPIAENVQREVDHATSTHAPIESDTQAPVTQHDAQDYQAPVTHHDDAPTATSMIDDPVQEAEYYQAPSAPAPTPIADNTRHTVDDHVTSTPAHETPTIETPAPIAESVQRTTHDHAHETPATIDALVQPDVQAAVTDHDDAPVTTSDARIADNVQHTTDDNAPLAPEYETPAIADAPPTPIHSDIQAPVPHLDDAPIERPTPTESPIAQNVQREVDHATSTHAYEMPAPIQPDAQAPIQRSVQPPEAHDYHAPVTQHDDVPTVQSTPSHAPMTDNIQRTTDYHEPIEPSVQPDAQAPVTRLDDAPVADSVQRATDDHATSTPAPIADRVQRTTDDHASTPAYDTPSIEASAPSEAQTPAPATDNIQRIADNTPTLATPPITPEPQLPQHDQDLFSALQAQNWQQVADNAVRPHASVTDAPIQRTPHTTETHHHAPEATPPTPATPSQAPQQPIDIFQALINANVIQAERDTNPPAASAETPRIQREFDDFDTSDNDDWTFDNADDYMQPDDFVLEDEHDELESQEVMDKLAEDIFKVLNSRLKLENERQKYKR